jgi:hypothetical protein
MRKKIVLFFAPLLIVCEFSYADELLQHDHTMMHHGSSATTPLTQPGNSAFAAVQEVVEKLMADPNTDWSRVNLEALRLHLVDMNNFTLHVKVVSQKPVKNGVEFTVLPTTDEAAGSLDRLFAAHPAILKQESGWDMRATKNKGGGYTARVTSNNPNDVEKIRGLGYIGIVALGKHHQLHHWQMAIGVNPHQHHDK